MIDTRKILDLIRLSFDKSLFNPIILRNQLLIIAESLDQCAYVGGREDEGLIRVHLAFQVCCIEAHQLIRIRLILLIVDCINFFSVFWVDWLRNPGQNRRRKRRHWRYQCVWESERTYRSVNIKYTPLDCPKQHTIQSKTNKTQQTVGSKNQAESLINLVETVAYGPK